MATPVITTPRPRSRYVAIFFGVLVLGACTAWLASPGKSSSSSQTTMVVVYDPVSQTHDLTHDAGPARSAGLPHQQVRVRIEKYSRVRFGRTTSTRYRSSIVPLDTPVNGIEPLTDPQRASLARAWINAYPQWANDWAPLVNASGLEVTVIDWGARARSVAQAFILAFPFAVCITGATALAIRKRRQDRRLASRCVECGYDLRGIPDGEPCPECGAQRRPDAR